MRDSQLPPPILGENDISIDAITLPENVVLFKILDLYSVHSEKVHAAFSLQKGVAPSLLKNPAAARGATGGAAYEVKLVSKGVDIPLTPGVASSIRLKTSKSGRVPAHQSSSRHITFIDR